MRRKCFIGLIGVLMVLPFIFATPYVQSAEKVDIHINTMLDLTGPYSGTHQLEAVGFKQYAKWANEKEIVPGANIVLDIVDTGAEVSKGIVAFQMAASQKHRAVVSTGGHTSNVAISLKQIARRLKIPIYGGGETRAMVVPPGWSFGHQASYEGQVSACAQWAKDNWKPDSKDPWIRKHYENRNPRFAILGWDNAMGRAFDQKETRDYLKKIGVDYVGSEYIPMSPSDTSPQLLRLVQEKGVDFIYFGMFPSTIAVVLKNAEGLGLREEFQDFSFWASSIIQLHHYAGDLANRSMMLTGYKIDPAEWEIPYFVDQYKKTKAPLVAAAIYAGGASFMSVKFEAIRRAALKVGVDKVDGKAVYNALINMKAFKPSLYHSTVGFSETKRVGADTAVMYQLQKGKLAVIARDLYVPDLLPGGKDVVK